MQMLYNSDSFAVVLFDVAEATSPAAALGTADADASTPAKLTHGGYEIVDKFARKEIFLQGAMAERVLSVCVHGVQSRRRTQLQAGGDGCAPRGRGRPSACRHGGWRARNQARRRGVGDGREDGRMHELPQVHALAQAGLMNAEATRQELIAAQ